MSDVFATKGGIYPKPSRVQGIGRQGKNDV
jgi:hypothetical protein